LAAKYILAALSVVFLILGISRLGRDAGKSHPQSRAWLLIGVIFGTVSVWLFYQG